MKSLQASLLWAALGAMMALIGGCGARSRSANYQVMNCVELNNGIADTANAIGRTAITRANINVPFWLPYGTRTKEKLQARQTARIERLRQEQAALKAARASRCP
jgi:hypothetical protein